MTSDQQLGNPQHPVLPMTGSSIVRFKAVGFCERMASMEADDGRVTLCMSARIWAGIDAGVDNASSMAAQNGDEATVALSQRIRQAGWDQVPWVDGAWPPMDEIISIRLSRAEWAFAADEARHSIPIYEELGDDDSAQLGRDALATIENAHL